MRGVLPFPRKHYRADNRRFILLVARQLCGGALGKKQVALRGGFRAGGQLAGYLALALDPLIERQGNRRLDRAQHPIGGLDAHKQLGMPGAKLRKHRARLLQIEIGPEIAHPPQRGLAIA